VVVASAFHKGRLRFTWDPNYIANTGAPELNVAFSHVVDLEGKRDFIVDIPWGQPDPFLPVLVNIANNVSSSTRYAATAYDANGVFAVHVQNSLTVANDLPSTVTVLVFKSCPDLCVAVPEAANFSGMVNAYSATPQALEVDMSETTPESCEPVSTAPPESLGVGMCDEDQLKIFFGEAVVSFRSLLKRYMLHSVYSFAGAASVLYYWTNIITDFPCYKGYSANAIHRTAAAGKFNYTHQTLINYLAPAFLCVRGSTRSKYVFAGTASEQAFQMSVTRTYNETPASTPYTVGLTNTNVASRAMIINMENGFNGATTTPLLQQPVIEVEHPYYKACRFDLAKDIDLSLAANTRGGLGLGAMTHRLTLLIWSTGNKIVHRYVAGGEDLTMSFFQGAPPMAFLPDATLPAA
jgi:hypothetical protein